MDDHATMTTSTSECTTTPCPGAGGRLEFHGVKICKGFNYEALPHSLRFLRY